jgi:hypothetical protein
MLENKFYKVAQGGYSFITATYFNPVTKEYKSVVARDYDYADCSRDNDEVYYEEINEEARRAWLHFNGEILVGDTIEVIKGRTLPHGFIGTVRKVCDFKDRYGRYVATYAYFEEGGKINIDNCKLVKGV